MTPDWRPTAQPQQWRQRAQLLAAIRQFFAERDVLEVETPLLCHATGTDPQLDFFTSRRIVSGQSVPLYLQTSPEFAMKRLLAAGSGCIYQICKAFRQGESGRFHNPEFTILEWYRVGFDLAQLMDEVATLLSLLLPDRLIKRCSYTSIFNDYLELNPLQFERSHYRQRAEKLGFLEADRLCGNDHGIWLDFLFSHCIQPKMVKQEIQLVYGYPSVLSSLARLNSHDPRISERVEVFVDGVELGNGYHELIDAEQQASRFNREIEYRRINQLPSVDRDDRLLAAIQHGLPDCSGIAIGIDRLLMVLQGLPSIDAAIAFPIELA